MVGRAAPATDTYAIATILIGTRAHFFSPSTVLEKSVAVMDNVAAPE